jgi:hypothetical protein
VVRYPRFEPSWRTPKERNVTRIDVDASRKSAAVNNGSQIKDPHAATSTGKAITRKLISNVFRNSTQSGPREGAGIASSFFVPRGAFRFYLVIPVSSGEH